MTRPIFAFFCWIVFFSNLQAQCPAILTDTPIEVCSSGGTKANIDIDGTVLSALWSPAIGLDTTTILNPTFVAPIDTTYLLTIIGLDEETKDTCTIQKLLTVNITTFEVNLAQDTVELPCGDTIQLAANVRPSESFFIVEWETSEGNFTRGNQTLTPLVDAIGQYEVNIIGNLGRIVCRDTASLQVALSKAETITIETPETLHCNQNSITLAVANQENPTNYLYRWTTIDGAFSAKLNQYTAEVEQAGQYEVSRTNLFGDCETTATITVANQAISDFSVEQIEPTCNQGGVLNITNPIGGQAPFQYSIDSGVTFQATPTFEDLTESSYSILVVDANGCQQAKPVNFSTAPSFTLSLIPFQEVERDILYQMPLSIEEQATNIATIQWWPNVGLSCTDCPQPFLTEYKNRQYEVTITDETGCMQQATIRMAIRQPNLLYSPTVFSPNEDGQNDDFSVFINTKHVQQLTSFSIFDRYGNLLAQSTNKTNEEIVVWDGSYKGRAMPIGAYLYAAELELLNGDIERISGTLNLIR